VSKPIEVAVIGGGCAAMAAAFELTRPEHAGKYHVTVYQLGFRLGGKGASGRGRAQRIEEHGLHLWMGFYENAFRLMRECYAEAERDPSSCPIHDWRQAFVPDNFNAVADRSPSGTWLPWKVQFPPLPGLPGDSDASQHAWSVADYLTRSMILLRTLLEASQLGPAAASDSQTPHPSALMEGIARVLRIGQLATFGALLEALRFMELALSAAPQYPAHVLLRLHEIVATSVQQQLEAFIARDDEQRRLWEIVDLTLAVVRGSIRFQLLTDPRGFDAIDAYDCREWLRLNGAAARSVNSAFVRALYDLAFAYEDGDCQRPRIAAGQAIRGALRAFFTYRGAFFWKMQAGMGDIVFAPLWEVLKKRGVRFEFFHRLEQIRLGDAAPGEKPFVSALEFDVQAETRDAAEYAPLVNVKGLPCWPAQPDYDQLLDGARLRAEGWNFESHWDKRKVATKTLRVTEDFDCVVLGVGVGALPYVSGELAEREPRWAAMLAQVKSVATQACQIWLKDDMKTLGWHDGPVNLSGFVEPFDTWADMTHLVPREQHAERVRAIAYFCSVLPDPPADQDCASASYPAQRAAEVRAHAIRFLNRDIAQLWHNAAPAGRFRWEALATGSAMLEETLQGEDRFATQYWRANVEPSDRYALSLPGSSRHRISPLERLFDNLTIAGDYTDCGFNEGCVEAAVMSGRLAAHAISELPPLADIVGYDHP
jgi:uncharacterized protein with NAD-binding domain and iron-sulfur cluster